MAESVDDYLEFCAEVGKGPERPYRGEFLVRTTPDLHRAATIESEASGMSLNAWVEATITSVVKERRPEYGGIQDTKRKGAGRRKKAPAG
jgi:predicted HicB family RNase H-like nuclease